MIPLSGSGLDPRTGSVSGSTANLTNSTYSYCQQGPPQDSGADAVYSFTPDVKGGAVVTMTANFNLTFYARTVCDDDGTDLGGCWDYADTVNSGSLVFGVEPKTTYYLFIDGDGGNSGKFTLHVNITPKGPEDTCPGKSVGFTASGPRETATVEGDTNADNDSTSGSCVGANRNDAVYALTSDLNGPMHVLLGPDFEGGMYARTSCASSSSELACTVVTPDAYMGAVNGFMSFQATAGTTYYVFVDGQNQVAKEAASGPFTLMATVGQPGPEDACPGKTVNLTSNSTGETATVKSNTLFDNDGIGWNSSQHDAVYAFTPSISGQMGVLLHAPTFSPGLEVRPTCSDPSSAIASGTGNLGEDVSASATVTAGKTYYVFVGGYNDSDLTDGNAGPFTLTVGVAP